MPRDEENYVALFIDWDNLAISTAVDFGGALPDVRAIVKAAQRSGTVLLARAYAEWNATSDRLAVYRAGIDPVYAPTFRFEPEPGSQTRGKSLADPCLVTDCIDTMHLMPEINTFVLVSGDKDLIPIVRLAQLRGKRVVVIGPDYVAAILREMADEYIPYRLLAETSDSPPSTEISPYGARGQRRHQAANARNSAPSNGQHAPARHVAPPIVARQPAAIAAKAVTSEPNGSDGVEAVPTARVEAPKPEPVAEQPRVTEPVRSPEEATLDSAPLFETISTILREREQTGKPRLRSTNLKDQLIARISGFNERKYGFGRFKDLLAAAEKTGVLTVSRTGPVQWVSAVSTAPPVSETKPEAAPIEAAAPAVEPAISAASEPASPTDDDADVVRFILGLRSRSRWLTYTYLMTNLLNHLGKGSADAAADTAVRTTLNRLVQGGVLVVDREPREIDVSGVRHRVKMCHLVDEHPLVSMTLAQVAAEAEATPAEPTPAVEAAPSATPEAAVPSSGTERPEVAETEAAAAPPASIEGPSLAAVEAIVEVLGTETTGPAENGGTSEPEPASASAAVTAAPEMIDSTPTAEATVAAAPPIQGEAAIPTEEIAPSVPHTEPAAPIADALPAPQPSDAPTEEQGKGTATSEGGETSEPTASSNGQGNGHSEATLTLEESFAILSEVVREATGPARPSTGPAAVKNRLVRRLGSFDERAFGFGKFKDYLLAAERAGAVRIEVVGTSARVSLPAVESEATDGETASEG